MRLGRKLIVSVLVFGSLSAETLTWEAPTKNMDGTNIQPGALKEYHIYDQRKIVRIVPVPTQSVTISTGTTAHVWEATVVDKTGAQSDYSNAVEWYPTPVPTLQWPPTGPSNLTLK